VLVRLNRELDADFDVDAFSHVAVWNEDDQWIEMRLRCATPQLVRVPSLDIEVEFAPGEDVRTEISAKFTPARIAGELAAAGLTVIRQWSDPAGDFLLTLAAPRT
jgi:L-histidine N-alpha-methyltransferase